MFAPRPGRRPTAARHSQPTARSADTLRRSPAGTPHHDHVPPRPTARADLRRRPIEGRLLFEPAGDTTNYVLSVVTPRLGARAEMCQAHAGPGDAVTLERGARRTRSACCPELGGRGSLARPPRCRNEVSRPEPERTWLWPGLYGGDRTMLEGWGGGSEASVRHMNRTLLAESSRRVRPGETTVCLGGVALRRAAGRQRLHLDVARCPSERPLIVGITTSTCARIWRPPDSTSNTPQPSAAPIPCSCSPTPGACRRGGPCGRSTPGAC